MAGPPPPGPGRAFQRLLPGHGTGFHQVLPEWSPPRAEGGGGPRVHRVEEEDPRVHRVEEEDPRVQRAEEEDPLVHRGRGRTPVCRGPRAPAGVKQAHLLPCGGAVCGGERDREQRGAGVSRCDPSPSSTGPHVLEGSPSRSVPSRMSFDEPLKAEELGQEGGRVWPRESSVKSAPLVCGPGSHPTARGSHTREGAPSAQPGFFYPGCPSPQGHLPAPPAGRGAVCEPRSHRPCPSPRGCICWKSHEAFLRAKHAGMGGNGDPRHCSCAQAHARVTLGFGPPFSPATAGRGCVCVGGFVWGVCGVGGGGERGRGGRAEPTAELRVGTCCRDEEANRAKTAVAPARASLIKQREAGRILSNGSFARLPGTTGWKQGLCGAPAARASALQDPPAPSCTVTPGSASASP